MRKVSILTATLVISLAPAGITFADTGHGHGDGANKADPATAMQGHHDKMQMMMRMHSDMIGGNDMGQLDILRMMMGAGDTPGMTGSM